MKVCSTYFIYESIAYKWISFNDLSFMHNINIEIVYFVYLVIYKDTNRDLND